MKLKCEKGKLWASGETDGENLFRRLARAGTAYRGQAGPGATGGVSTGKSSAAVDWGDPRKSLGGEATVAIACKSDADVEAGVARAVAGDPDGREVQGGGVDFVWARLRELEAMRGWWNRNRIAADDPAGPPAASDLPAATVEQCLGDVARRLRRLYDALPPCTAFVVFSGSGDPRDMSRLHAQRAQHKREYAANVKWADISAPWTDTEDQMLRRAVRQAREGIGFVTVK